jgi:dipeptidyl aminopeptidase/acylaminoacyl peptidase
METGSRSVRSLLVLAFVLLWGCASFAQNGAQNNGVIVEQTPCAPNPIGSYEQYIESANRSYTDEYNAAKIAGVRMAAPENLKAHLLNKADFEEQKSYAGFECQRIKYLSDGLKVVGFIWKPKNTQDRKLPLIILNHGGYRDVGKLLPWSRFGYYTFVSNGFVLIASQYRGVDGGEGQDEHGGADVHDVLNLIPLAKSLGYVDMNNVFMLGWSRGGMMTYLALKNGIPVNAVAVGSGVTDLIDSLKKTPQLAGPVLKELIPDYDKRGEELLRERSAVYWPEKISVPVLIMHGSGDWRADAGSQALAFAQRLQALGKTYELIIYADDGHGVPLNRADSDRRIIEWFRKYMK